MDDYKEDGNNAGDEEAPQSNLWREFLKSAVASGGRGQQSVGHLVVFGAQSSGKSTLVAQFGKLESRFNEMKRFLMMRYAYCHITASDSDDTYSLLNIWQVSEPAHAQVLDVVIPMGDMSRVSYVICVDLSRPATIESEYKKWMACVESTQSRLLARCEPLQADALKLALSSHIQTWVDPKDVTEQLDDDEDNDEQDSKEEAAVDRKSPETNVGAAVIVVATKCDVFRSKFQAEADAEDHFEIVCSYIRWWSLAYGAASFSMALGMKDQARRILSYINHRVFGAKFERSPHAVVKLSNLKEQFLFIPSGFDHKETIKLQNPNRNLEETPFSDFFKPKEKRKKELALKPKKQSDENEKFLKTVMFDLRGGSGGARGGGGGASSAAQKAASSVRMGNGVTGSSATSGGGADGANGKNGADVSKFFQRLMDPSQAPNGNT